jgi:hypothetical protein
MRREPKGSGRSSDRFASPSLDCPGLRHCWMTRAVGFPKARRSPRRSPSGCGGVARSSRGGTPDVLPDSRSYLRACHARGCLLGRGRTNGPVALDGVAARRVLQRLLAVAVAAAVLSSSPARVTRSVPLAVVADAAFWAGARAAATGEEWARLTASSYVVLTYHRLAGDRTPGQERLDVDPAMFRRHLRWLRRLGFRPLSP